jgi:hypothetical protein
MAIDRHHIILWSPLLLLPDNRNMLFLTHIISQTEREGVVLSKHNWPQRSGLWFVRPNQSPELFLSGDKIVT